MNNANLHGTRLGDASLWYVQLGNANLTDADLTGADLFTANLTGATVEQAILTGCKVFGVSAWALKGTPRGQQELDISHDKEHTITVDNLELAQFIYLLLDNSKVRDVIDTVTSKVVLILGRFTNERKAVLNAMRKELRKTNHTPIMFDFRKPAGRTLTETVSTLAHMARFVIADMTDAKSLPQELQRIVPDLPSLPLQPVILDSQYEYAMFEHFRNYPWVLPTYRYADAHSLVSSLAEKVVEPAVAKSAAIERERRQLENALSTRRMTR